MGARSRPELPCHRTGSKSPEDDRIWRISAMILICARRLRPLYDLEVISASGVAATKRSTTNCRRTKQAQHGKTNLLRWRDYWDILWRRHLGTSACCQSGGEDSKKARISSSGSLSKVLLALTAAG